MHGVAARIDAAWDTITHQLRRQAAIGRTSPIVTSITHPQEAPMVSIKEIEADATAIVRKFEQVDHQALGMFDTVMTNQEAAAVLSDLAGLVGINVAPGVIEGFGRGLKTALGLFAPAAPPAGQGAGQASS